MGRGGWPSGRILVHFRAFEPKPRCRGTRATFGLHAVLATCPVFAFGARNPLFLGLKLAVGISVALQFGPFCHQLLHADGGDVRSRGAQFRSGSPMGCMWRLMSARGGSRGSCCRVLACFSDLEKKRPPYPKYPTLGACRATKPHKRGHVHSPPTPWVLGVAWPCAWALCGHSEQVSTVFLAPHMSIHRHMDRFSQKSGYFWSNFEKIISKSASKWDFTP
jgi:hypothetical protein